MGKALLLCDKGKSDAKSSHQVRRPRRKLTKSPSVPPKQHTVLASQNHDVSKSPAAATPAWVTMMNSASSPDGQPSEGSGEIFIMSSPTWITEEGSSSPVLTIHPSPRLGDDRTAANMSNSLLPSLNPGTTQPQIPFATMDARPQSRTSAFSSPLQRIFGRKQTSVSLRQPTLPSQRQHEFAVTQAFPYEDALEGPQPVYLTSLRVYPDNGVSMSRYGISRSQSARDPSSEGNSGSSPSPSSRSTRLRFSDRSEMDGSPRSGHSLRLLDITSWSYKRKPKTITKHKIKIFRSSSPPRRPAPPSDVLSPLMTVTDLPEMHEQHFSSSPPASATKSEEVASPTIWDTASIYSQDTEGRKAQSNMNPNASSLDVRTGGSPEQLEKRIKEHRRLAYYCINGSSRQPKAGGEHDVPVEIFKDKKGKGKEEGSAGSGVLLNIATSLRVPQQLSRISEDEPKYGVDSPIAVAEKRRRRQGAGIPPSEQEAFNEFMGRSAQEAKRDSETKAQTRVEVTADGKVIDRGASPPPVPQKNADRRLIQAQQKFQADRPIRRSPLQTQSWWERQGILLPDTDEIEDKAEQPKSQQQRVLSEEIEHISPTPRSPSLPHFHTVEDAEAYRLSQSSAISSAAVDTPAQRNCEITALPKTHTVNDRELVATASEGKEIPKPMRGKTKGRDKSRFSQWLEQNKQQKGMLPPSTPPIFPPASPQPNSSPTTSAPSGHASSTAPSLSAAEKIKLRPEPLNLTPHSTRSPPTTTALPSPLSTWHAKSPFFDARGHLISRSERQKRFAQIRAAAVQAFERSLSSTSSSSSSPSPITPVPRTSGAPPEQIQSPATSEETRGLCSSSASAGHKVRRGCGGWEGEREREREREREETPPSSPPPPSGLFGYEGIALGNPYLQADHSSSEGEIVDLYLHPEDGPEEECGGERLAPPPPIGYDREELALQTMQEDTDGFGAGGDGNRRLQQAQREEFQPPPRGQTSARCDLEMDPHDEERRQWYESDAKKRIDKIRKALQTKSVYGSENGQQ